MTSRNPEDARPEETSYEPNWVLPHYGAVREDNWAEYEAQGFRPMTELDGFALEGFDVSKVVPLVQFDFGAENVLTGDAFDEDAQRPLRHKPGESIYLSPEGVKYQDQRRAAMHAARQAHHPSSDEPASS